MSPMIFLFRQVHAGCHARTRLRGIRGFKEGHTDQRRIVMFLRSCKILHWWEWSKVMTFSKYTNAPAICVQDEFEINALNIHEHSSAFLSRTTQPYVCCLQPLEESYHMNDTHWVGWKEVHAPLCAHHFPSKGETSVELLQSHGLTKPRFDGGGFLAHFPFFRKISQFNFIKDILAGPRICWFQHPTGFRLDFVVLE